MLVLIAAVVAILYQRGAFDAILSPRDEAAKTTANGDRPAEKPPEAGKSAPVDGAEKTNVSPPADTPDSSAAPTKTSSAESPTVPASLVIENVTLRNEAGRVVYRGSVDLGPTLDRIRRGERLSFPHDGTIFQNREGRLPRKSAGYYREYVHPTPRLPGPGPQRIVTGAEGEVYYTADHYQTFRKLAMTVRRE